MNAQIDATNPDGDLQLGLTPAEARAMMADPHSPVGKGVQQGFGNSPGSRIGSHPCFDSLIDHPGYIQHVKDFVNGELTAMTGGGAVMQRWPGQASGVHGGGQNGNALFNYNDEEGTFLCKAVNLMVALNDCPFNGGNTAIVVRSRSLLSSCAAVPNTTVGRFLPAVACRSLGRISPTSGTPSKRTRPATPRTSGTATRTKNGATAEPSAREGTWTEYREQSR